MSSEYPQIICTSSKIKDGCLDDVKAWLKVLEKNRREETLESFLKEGVRLEAAFIKEEKETFFLIYFMRAENVEQAMKIFRNSFLPIDIFHGQCWANFTEAREILSPIFHLETQI